MKVAVDDKGACRKVLTVDVPADAVNPGYEDILKIYRKAAKIAGFRKGKAPQAVVEKTYAKEIGEDVKERLLPTFYREAVESKGIDAVSVVGVDSVEFSKDSGMKFVITVDVAPEFKLAKYKKITLKSESVEVTDKDVTDAVDRLKESFSKFEDVEGREVKASDLVLIDYTGTIDDNPAGDLAPEGSGLGEAKDFWALVDQPEFIPGFVDGVLGMKIGDEKELRIHFPDDFRVPEVSGKDAVYNISLKGMREKIMPELDEDLFKKLEVESEDALLQRIREDLTKGKEQSENNRLKHEATRVLLDKTSFDLPESILEQEVQQTARSMVQNMMQQGVPRDQLEAQSAELLENARETSKDRVKLSYILDRIGNEENIEVAESDVDERLTEMSARYGMTADQLRGEMEKNNRLDGFKEEIRAQKTLDFILEHAKIKK